jgi:hypothetical protein
VTAVDDLKARLFTTVEGAPPGVVAYAKRIGRGIEALASIDELLASALTEDIRSAENVAGNIGAAATTACDAVMTITTDDMDAAVDAACYAVRCDGPGARERHSAAIRAAFVASGFRVIA